MRTKRRVGILLAAMGLALGLATPASLAEPATALRLQADTNSAVDFWTPENMRAATPLDGPLQTVGDLLGAVTKGLPSLIPASSSTGAAWSGGGKVTKTAGRVFFLFNGAKASCSGDAVTSGNKSVVITAGHCVKYQGTWHTNWVFVPGYNNGNAPYGEWPAKATLTT